jgi:hypothetical protein
MQALLLQIQLIHKCEEETWDYIIDIYVSSIIESSTNGAGKPFKLSTLQDLNQTNSII